MGNHNCCAASAAGRGSRTKVSVAASALLMVRPCKLTAALAGMLRAHLRAVKNAGLIHVIPDIKVLGGALILAQGELGSPPVACCWVEHIQVGGGARPAPPAHCRSRRWEGACCLKRNSMLFVFRVPI